jgi:glycosyltransferase EpsD
VNWLLYYPVEKWMARYTDKLITINEEDYQLAKRNFSCPVFRIHGVGANSEAFKPADTDEQQRIKAELGLSGHVLITVGELLPNKNQKTAILALKKILASYPDTCLLIAGNGPEKGNLEETVRALGLQDNVRFLGYTTQLHRYLKAADVEIACSYREGLPLNVLEAMLCGKPVVASDNRGHREVIKEGINGFIVNADDADAYADAVCRILSGEMNSSLIRESIKPYTDLSVSQELKAIYLGEAQQ